ncbi:MAG: hypothetical protein CH6_0843 [Candidatus Kapaibacterium sp.]|nr:MAG: hypothetical protein CH6_0843 [Candidatus Kapabacteria bacterium]
MINRTTKILESSKQPFFFSVKQNETNRFYILLDLLGESKCSDCVGRKL